MDVNVNEIVGIRDYERGGEVIYLPALALIDYANQAIESTSGKIVEVSLTVATLGIGGGAAAGRVAAEELITSTAIWGARLGRAAQILDRAATVVEIAAFVINENRDWIISKLGEPGRRLVRLSDIASSAVAVYGLTRLGQGGYHLVKEMRAASKEARAASKNLTSEQSNVLNRVDDETDHMLKELDEDAAKRGAPASTAEQPGTAGHVESPAAPSPPAKVPGKGAAVANELDDAASKIGISTKRLEAEVQDLRSQTPDLDSVREPKNAKLDAEMDAQGHKFTRNKNDRTWCRESRKKCKLNFGEPLNSDVDTALVMKKQAKFEKLEQERKAREAAPPRQPAPKREPATVTDPKAAKAEAQAKKMAVRASAQGALQSHIGDAKSLELQLRVELAKAEQRLKKPLDSAKRAKEEAKKQELINQLNNQIDARNALQKQLDDLAITPYMTAPARSRYSDSAANEIVGRAQKAIDAPGGQKKLAIVDEMSGKPIKNPSIDHVVPVDDMVLMEGWDLAPAASATGAPEPDRQPAHDGKRRQLLQGQQVMGEMAARQKDLRREGVEGNGGRGDASSQGHPGSYQRDARGRGRQSRVNMDVLS